MIRLHIEEKVTFELMATAAVLADTADGPAKTDPGVPPSRERRELLEFAPDRPRLDALQVRQFLYRLQAGVPAVSGRHGTGRQQAVQRRRENIGPDLIDLAPQQRAVRRIRHLRLGQAQQHQSPHRGADRALLVLLAYLALELDPPIEANRLTDAAVLSLSQYALVVLDRAFAGDRQRLRPFVLLRRQRQCAGQFDPRTDVVLVADGKRLSESDGSLRGGGGNGDQHAEQGEE